MTAATQDFIAFSVRDTVGAWVPHGTFALAPTGKGPLDGLSFAAKDLYHVAGRVTGAGNPTWLATHGPAERTSPVIQALLAAGATLQGKVLTDELAYSIQGDNFHYGTPVNSRAPDRVPGGSSSGSAAAVSAGLVDFALGTDTGGSTRVPASYCGLWGLRTTHGALSCDEMVPLSPAFDTATWLAADAGVFERVGEVLLPQTAAPLRFGSAVRLADACALASEDFQAPIDAVAQALHEMTELDSVDAEVPGGELEHWRATYITASAYDAWQAHGAWIETHSPQFGDAIAGRWRMAAQVDQEAARTAFARQAELRAGIRRLLGPDGVAILPSASSTAPRRDATADEIEEARARTFRLTAIAGLGGLPQISLPFLTPQGLPVGVSLLGPAGSDLALIRLATAVGRRVGCLGAA